MKKIMLFLYFLIVFTSSLFSFSKTEPTTFIQEKMSENNDFTLVHTFSIGENKFLVLGKYDNYLQSFYSDGTTFMYPIDVSFHDYSDDYSYRESKNNFYYQDGINVIEQLIDKKWSNSEFILFVYNQNDVDYIKSIENDLIENGINVVYRKDIAPYHDFDVKYSLAKDDCHPNLFAWEYITPELVKSIQKKRKHYD